MNSGKKEKICFGWGGSEVKCNFTPLASNVSTGGMEWSKYRHCQQRPKPTEKELCKGPFHSKILEKRNHFIGILHYVFCHKKIFWKLHITNNFLIKATHDRRVENKTLTRSKIFQYNKKHFFKTISPHKKNIYTYI